MNNRKISLIMFVGLTATMSILKPCLAPVNDPKEVAVVPGFFKRTLTGTVNKIKDSGKFLYNHKTDEALTILLPALAYGTISKLDRESTHMSYKQNAIIGAVAAIPTIYGLGCSCYNKIKKAKNAQVVAAQDDKKAPVVAAQDDKKAPVVAAQADKNAPVVAPVVKKAEAANNAQESADRDFKAMVASASKFSNKTIIRNTQKEVIKNKLATFKAKHPGFNVSELEKSLR